MKIRILISFIFIFLSGCSSSIVVSEGEHRLLSSDKIKKYSKEGEACTQSVLFFQETNLDLTVDTARKSKGIEEIVFVEDKSFNIPLIYSRYCIVVKGN